MKKETAREYYLKQFKHENDKVSDLFGSDIPVDGFWPGHMGYAIWFFVWDFSGRFECYHIRIGTSLV